MSGISFLSCFSYQLSRVYEVFSDVNAYSSFLTGCTASKLTERHSPDVAYFLLELGYGDALCGALSLSFTSRVETDPNMQFLHSKSVDAINVSTLWEFRTDKQGVHVSTQVKFDLTWKQKLLLPVLKLLFSKVEEDFNARVHAVCAS